MSEQENYKLAIIPILTQVDPNDDEFDFDIFKDNFQKILKNELDKQFPEYEEEEDDKDQKKEKKKKKGDDDEMDEDVDFHEQKRIQVQKFFNAFVENIIVFDPLDRDIMTQDEEGEEHVISVKSADLK